MKAPEPVPRTQPYSNRVPAGSGAGARVKRQRVAQRGDRRERRCVEKADREQRGKRRRPEETQRHRRQGGAHGEHTPQTTHEVREAAAHRPRDEPDRCPGAEQDAELFGSEPAPLEEGRHERRGHAEGAVHECVQRNEPRKRTHPALSRLDAATMLQAARNSAAMIGPMTNPFTPKTESPPSVATSTT